MNQPPRLTDRNALARHRARTNPKALFLHDIAAAQTEERLELVKRSFSDVAIVTGHAEFWKTRWPGADVVPDTDTLSLEPGAHDLVIHAMAMHWADDPVGQVIQCRRALRPDGLFLSVAPGGQSLHELRTALAEGEARTRGGLSPRVAPMLDLRDAGALLQRAGLALPVADFERVTVTYSDAFALMRELRAMGEGNALHGRERGGARPALFRAAAEIYAAHYPDPDDPARVRATVDLIHLSGWAPDDSQPKPLRPGSASARLADALRTDERPLSDNSPDRQD